MIGRIVSDLRVTLRRLIHRPGLGLLAVVAIALGIGLTAAMFAIVDGVLFKGLPFDGAQRLVAISRVNLDEGPGRLVNRLADYRDLSERQTTLAGLAAYELTALNVSPPGEPPEVLSAAAITTNLLQVLAVQPRLGGGFSTKDSRVGAAPTVLLGHEFWRDRLGSDDDVVGQTLQLNGGAATIVGVMPENFAFPLAQRMWIPLATDVVSESRTDGPKLQLIGRVADGVSFAQAQSDMARVMDQLASEHPDTNAGMSAVVGPFTSELVGNGIPAFMYTMLGAVSLVLVIACVNVANLLLARASLRTKEIAVSSALGASRARLVRQLLMDAIVIAAAGALAGLGIAQLGIGIFNRAMQVQLTSAFGGVPFWFNVAIDPRTAAFVAVLTLGTTLFAGLLPALRASAANPNDALKDTARGASSLRIGRLSRALVVLEVALSFALLAGAGLMVQTIVNLGSEDLHFDTERLLTARVLLPAAEYPDSTQHHRFFARLREDLAALPGVVGATFANDTPVVGFANGRYAVESEVYQTDRDYPSARIITIDSTYLQTLGASVLDGRGFESGDAADTVPVALVNASLAAKHFPEGGAVGRRLAVRNVVQTGISERQDDRFYTIVGVLPDMYVDTNLSRSAEAIYTPFAQRPSSGATLIVRTAGDPLEMTDDVRRAVARLDPNLAISRPGSLAVSIDNARFFERTFGVMFAVFGVTALILAAIGLYGVLAFSVSQRTHEVGLRMALGASSGRVLGLVMRRGGGQMALGMALGLALALGFGRLLSLVLYDVSPSDPLVLGAVLATLGATGALATYLPARRATRADPLDAMRPQ